MVFITVKADEKILYIEKELIEAVVMRPAIQRVPGALDTIAGISWYAGELVIYYAAQICAQGSCGILLRNAKGRLEGILADEVQGEVQEDTGALVQMMSGVWEKISD